jgi:hypothetical protein
MVPINTTPAIRTAQKPSLEAHQDEPKWVVNQSSATFKLDETLASKTQHTSHNKVLASLKTFSRPSRLSKVNFEGCSKTTNTAANGQHLGGSTPVVILYHKHLGAFTSLIMLMGPFSFC